MFHRASGTWGEGGGRCGEVWLSGSAVCAQPWRRGWRGGSGGSTVCDDNDDDDDGGGTIAASPGACVQDILRGVNPSGGRFGW